MTSDSLTPLLQSVNTAYDKRQIRHGIVLREHVYAMREAQRDSEPPVDLSFMPAAKGMNAAYESGDAGYKASEHFSRVAQQREF